MRRVIQKSAGWMLSIAVVAGGCAGHRSASECVERSLTPPVLTMTAFRTGDNFGKPVDETTKKTGDPTAYIVLVNDNPEDPGSHLRKNANERLLLPPSDKTDNDIGRLRLEPPSPAPRTG